MKILITGANGLLGQKIVNQLINKNISFLATSNGINRNTDCPNEYYQAMDICNKKQVHQVVLSFCPTHIIHTAAITNVDACELNPLNCRLVNVDGAKNVFRAAVSVSAHFQLLSTDFVFDGLKGNYSEEDEVAPLSVYAKSKVAAENLLLQGDYANYSIVRTIIVYGKGNNLSRSNLFLWAKEALPKGEIMNVVDDQFRAPTWADDLAWGCIRICDLNETGIYHLSGPETYSIYEIVKKIARFYEYSTKTLNKIASKTLDQPAIRPPKTGFNLEKARKKLNYCPQTIEETLPLL